jgi:hypothetical protein
MSLSHNEAVKQICAETGLSEEKVRSVLRLVGIKVFPDPATRAAIEDWVIEQHATGTMSHASLATALKERFGYSVCPRRILKKHGIKGRSYSQAALTRDMRDNRRKGTTVREG